MLRKKKIISIILIVILAVLMTSCSKVDEAKVKLGLKNNDFEYIKQGKIKKIVIQNRRDPGFRFVVTDENAISDLYDILSTAKEVSTRSTLEPDYIFEMQESPNKVYRFNYIAGVDKEDGGNLYSDDKTYIVSKRIDNDIIKNFGNIRRPKDFEKIYYDSIIEMLSNYFNDNGNKDKSMGVDIYDDTEVAKFVFSQDLQDFSSRLHDSFQKVELKVNNQAQANSGDKTQKKTYDIDATVKTVGYMSDLYKAKITFINNADRSEKDYYIRADYKDARWITKVYNQDNKPKGEFD